MQQKISDNESDQKARRGTSRRADMAMRATLPALRNPTVLSCASGRTNKHSEFSFVNPSGITTSSLLLVFSSPPPARAGHCQFVGIFSMRLREEIARVSHILAPANHGREVLLVPRALLRAGYTREHLLATSIKQAL